MPDILNVQTKGAKVINPFAVAIGVPQIRITPNWLQGPNPPLQVNADANALEALSDANRRLASTQLMVSQRLPVLDSSFSIGGLTSLTLRTEKETVEIKSGWPLSTDLTIPISTSTSIECTAMELSPYTSALLSGLRAPEELGATLNANTGYIIGIGAPSIPVYHRVEIVYDFPKENKRFVIVLPKAQITSNEEMAFNPSDEMGISFTITASSAGFGTDDIAVNTWNAHPHGIKMFIDDGALISGTEDAALFTEYQIGSYVSVPTLNPTPANVRNEDDASFAVVTDGSLENLKQIKKGTHPVTVSTFGAAGDVVYTSS